MLVYGRNVAKEILESKKSIKSVILQKGFSDKTIISLIEKRNLLVKYMEKKELEAFAKYSHQGIILDIEDFKYANLDDFINNDNAVVLILDHLEDPHNLGAIIRTSEAAGVDGIIIPKDRGIKVNATVMKTSAGALNNMPISVVTNLNQTIKELKKSGFWIVGTDMDGASDYRDINYDGKIAIVIGNEGKGMSDIVKKSCDFVVKIPMYGKVNSLNASVSAGILIYEAIRNKR